MHRAHSEDTKMWEALLAQLRALEAAHGLLAVALSGGLDSRFLVHAAQKAGVALLPLHATGPHMPERESQHCRAWAEKRGLKLHEMAVDTLDMEGVRNNSRERCYHCKRRLLEILWEETRRAEPRAVLCDGTNADDRQAHRPGLRALREAGVRSPLAEAGLTKATLRRLGAATGLEDPQQKARPCLLTRLAYGLSPERPLLRRIEAAEQALEHLGLTEFRLRICPQPVLQTQPLTPVQGQRALALLHEQGFAGASLLEEESIGGFFDR